MDDPTESDILFTDMAHVKVFYDPTGNTLTVWFGNPQDEYYSWPQMQDHERRKLSTTHWVTWTPSEQQQASDSQGPDAAARGCRSGSKPLVRYPSRGPWHTP